MCELYILASCGLRDDKGRKGTSQPRDLKTYGALYYLAPICFKLLYLATRLSRALQISFGVGYPLRQPQPPFWSCSVATALSCSQCATCTLHPDTRKRGKIIRILDFSVLFSSLIVEFPSFRISRLWIRITSLARSTNKFSYRFHHPSPKYMSDRACL